MAKKRTKQQKIKSKSEFKISLAPVSQPKLEVADLLMSQPAEIKADLIKTVLVTLACLLCLAAWYWRLKIAGA
jgi:hypothetical protein